MQLCLCSIHYSIWNIIYTWAWAWYTLIRIKMEIIVNVLWNWKKKNYLEKSFYSKCGKCLTVGWEKIFIRCMCSHVTVQFINMMEFLFNGMLNKCMIALVHLNKYQYIFLIIYCWDLKTNAFFLHFIFLFLLKVFSYFLFESKKHENINSLFTFDLCQSSIFDCEQHRKIYFINSRQT